MEWVLISICLAALFVVISRRSGALALFLGSLASLSALIESVILSHMLAEFGFFVLTGICWAILGVITDEDGNAKKIRGKKMPILSNRPSRVIMEWCST